MSGRRRHVRGLDRVVAGEHLEAGQAAQRATQADVQVATHLPKAASQPQPEFPAGEIRKKKKEICQLTSPTTR
jgi:hypothetical protein